MAWDEQAYIDRVPVLGLSGVEDSLAYKVHEIEKHFHSRERWFGKSADQSGTDWNAPASGTGMPTLFRAISGNSDYGGDANDEAKVIGLGDSSISGKAMFDIHRIAISACSITTVFILRVIFGTGTMAAAITAGQYSEVMLRRNPGGGENHIMPIDLQIRRLTWGIDQVWIQMKSGTDNATVDFYVGLHEYAG